MQSELHRRPDAVALLTPLRQAAAFVGAPYELHGRTPAGWDCWGAVAHLRPLIFNRPTPSWAEAYTYLDGATSSQLADTAERLIGERLHAWTPCLAVPGAVALLSIFGRAAHVGLVLDPVHFIHALGGCETAIERLDSPRWSSRLIGCFDA